MAWPFESDRRSNGVHPARARGGRLCARASAWVPVLALALMSAGVSGCDAEPEAADGPPEVAPDFTLTQLGTAGQKVALASHAGKTVILDFWATWCVPCEFQVPELNDFFDAHRSDSDVALFGVSVDTAPARVVDEWVADKGVRYPILIGGDATARAFDLEGFPTVVVIRPDGTIDSRHAGLIQRDELEAKLSRIRAEAAALRASAAAEGESPPANGGSG